MGLRARWWVPVVGLVGVAWMVAAAPAWAAPAVYVPDNAPGGGVSAFSVAADGSLSAIAGSPFSDASFPSAVAVTPDGTHLYIANANTNAGVSAFSIAADGSLAAVPGSPFPMAGSPSAVAISPNGAYLYVATDSPDGVAAFSIAPDGSLSAVPGSPFPADSSPCQVAASPDGLHLYVTNSGSSDMSAFSIATNGSLTAVPGSPFPASGHPCGVSVTPDGAHLYVTSTDSGANVLGFSIAADGSLSAVPGSPFGAGVANGSAAVSPNGAYLYVTNQALSGSVSAFAIAADGSLSAVPGSPFTAGNDPIGVTMTPDGRYLYAANFGSTTVSAFAVGADGGLRAVSGSPFTAGDAPLYLAASPDQGPTASFSATPGAPGSASGFDASASSSADYPIAGYAWSFGDGQTVTSSSATVQHTYLTPGTYTVQLTVTDQAGCSQTEIYTGQTASCDGSAKAQLTQTITVPSQTLTVPPQTLTVPPQTLPGLPPIPHLSRLKVKPHKFRAATKGKTITTRIEDSAQIAYRDTLAARTTLVIYRKVPGVKRGHRCVAPHRGNQDHEGTPCTRLVLVGSFKHQDHTGTNRLRFTGRIHGHPLSPGNYELKATAKLAGQQSGAISSSFTILTPAPTCDDPDHDGDCDAPGQT